MFLEPAALAALKENEEIWTFQKKLKTNVLCGSIYRSSKALRVKKCTEANCSLRIEVLFFQALQVGHKFNTFSRVAFHNKELKNAKFPVTLP